MSKNQVLVKDSYDWWIATAEEIDTGKAGPKKYSVYSKVLCRNGQRYPQTLVFMPDSVDLDWTVERALAHIQHEKDKSHAKR